MIKLDNVTVKFGNKTLIDELSYEFKTGVSYAVTGQSGVGKTTLLNLAAGLIKPKKGRVISDSEHRAYVFQEPRLFKWLNATENVTAVISGVSRETAIDAAHKIMYSLGLPEESFSKMPDELSGGMQQRVSIARALASQPEILFLDEPFKGLDPQTRAKVRDVLFGSVKGKTVIMVTHDADDEKFADVTLHIPSSPVTGLEMAKSSILQSE